MENQQGEGEQDEDLLSVMQILETIHYQFYNENKRDVKVAQLWCTVVHLS